MADDYSAYSLFLKFLDQRTIKSRRYQNAVKKLEKDQADPAAQRAARQRKMKRLMAQEDRQVRAAQRLPGPDR